MPMCFSSARMASLALRLYFSRRAALPTAWISRWRLAYEFEYCRKQMVPKGVYIGTEMLFQLK